MIVITSLQLLMYGPLRICRRLAADTVTFAPPPRPLSSSSLPPSTLQLPSTKHDDPSTLHPPHASPNFHVIQPPRAHSETSDQLRPPFTPSSKCVPSSASSVLCSDSNSDLDEHAPYGNISPCLMPHARPCNSPLHLPPWPCIPPPPLPLTPPPPLHLPPPPPPLTLPPPPADLCCCTGKHKYPTPTRWASETPLPSVSSYNLLIVVSIIWSYPLIQYFIALSSSSSHFPAKAVQSECRSSLPRITFSHPLL